MTRLPRLPALPSRRALSYATRPAIARAIIRPDDTSFCANEEDSTLPPSAFPSCITRLRAEEALALTGEQFVERFDPDDDHGGTPCLISGLAASWPALMLGRWTSVPSLARRCHDVAEDGIALFEVGRDEQDEPVLIEINEFADYVASEESARHKNPLYCFDDCFETDCPELLEDYAVPGCFAGSRMDLLSLLDPEPGRIGYRWLLAGPTRAGTELHVDPFRTAAWNTLTAGAKRWIIMSPALRDDPAVAAELDDAGEAAESGHGSDIFGFFADLESLAAGITDRRPAVAATQCFDFVQHPGETVFLPSGWIHAAMSLEPTVAITHNFAHAQNVRRVFKDMECQRPEMASAWRKRLQESFPEVLELLPR